MDAEQSIQIVLGAIYSKWNKKSIRNPYDVFEHRIQYAKNERTVGEFVEKLCNKLSIQSPSLKIHEAQWMSSIEYARANENEFMDKIRRETKLMAALGRKWSKS